MIIHCKTFDASKNIFTQDSAIELVADATDSLYTIHALRDERKKRLLP